MKTFVSALLLIFLAPGFAFAQSSDAPENPVTSSLTDLHQIVAGYIMATAEMLDDEMYAYRPSDDVRTTGEMLGHIANAQYLFCSVAAGEENPSDVNYEEVASSKNDIVTGLRDAFDYCGRVYNGMTDEEGAQMRNLFGMNLAASAVLAFNSSHNFEHYGNLVTYMRLNGIVPPSSM